MLTKLNFLLSAALVLTACDDSHPARPSGIPLADVPTEYASAICEVFDRCMGEEFLALWQAFSGGFDCEDRLTEQLTNGELPNWEAAIEARRAEYHADKTDACLAALRAFTCEELGLQRTPDECEEAMEGLVAIGGECESNIECVGSAFCDGRTACPGDCSALLAEGQACEEDDQCADGLSCQNEVCSEPAGLGDPCGGGVEPDCVMGYFCAGEDGDSGTPGECTEPESAFAAAQGESCDFENGELCTPDLACEISLLGSVASGECVTKLASGAACTAAIPDECPVGEYCAGLSFGGVGMPDLEGTCTALPTATQPCSALSNLCASGLVCLEDTTVCATVNENGQPCAYDEECYSDYCDADSDTCGPKQAC